MIDKKNDVYVFNIYLENDILSETVYTKEGVTNENELIPIYFTKEKIEELKQRIIEQIQKSENPFFIACNDTDCGYNVDDSEFFTIPENKNELIETNKKFLKYDEENLYF